MQIVKSPGFGAFRPEATSRTRPHVHVTGATGVATASPPSARFTLSNVRRLMLAASRHARSHSRARRRALDPREQRLHGRHPLTAARGRVLRDALAREQKRTHPVHL